MTTNSADTREKLLDQASLWVARLDRGLDSEERVALQAFLREPQARDAFLRFAALHERLDELSGLAGAPAPRAGQAANAAPRFYRVSALAAVLLLAVGLTWTILNFRTEQAETRPTVAGAVVYETLVGEQSVLKLPDGSEVSLNTDSRLRVSFSPQGRLAVLEHGEAHFDVQPDPYRPFTVRSGDYLVQVTGTSFSVYRGREDAVEVVVKEGSVRVKAVPQVASAAAPAVEEPPALLVGGDTLIAGDAGLFEARSGEPRLSRLDASQLADRLAWRHGKLMFRGETLEQALAEISRYTALQFEFLDERARHVKVAGVFKSGDVDGLLSTLESNFEVAYQRIDDRLVLITSR